MYVVGCVNRFFRGKELIGNIYILYNMYMYICIK